MTDKLWGRSPWTFDELHNASIECVWIDESIRWIGFGTVKVKERPNGEQKIEVVCKDLINGVQTIKTIPIPPNAFDSIKLHQDSKTAKYIIQN